MKSAPNIVLAIITACIVIVAIVAAVFASRDRTPNWPSDSPEAVVHEYMQAVLDGDYERAIGQLDPQLGCTFEDFERAFYPEDTAISLVQAHIGPEQATVSVEIGSYGEPFLEPFIGEEQFEMRSEDDTWLISAAPWPVYDCVGSL